MGSMTEEGRATLISALGTFVAAIVAICLPLIEWMPRGSIVGWLLVIVGVGELVFGLKRISDLVGRAVLVSGILTGLTGMAIVTGTVSGYLAIRNLVMVWLLLRGSSVLVLSLLQLRGNIAAWLAFSAALDLLLGVLLVFGLSGSALVVTLFGPTPLIVAKFSLIIAVSLLGTALSQLMIANHQLTKHS